ncbi:MAG: asparagine synthase (glutamine-hydrolyzing), partial [Calditrichaeota bacterium]|nr:asparagine synthase (glutamine-hydrolyzing) [Calditrichota bacterium]
FIEWYKLMCGILGKVYFESQQTDKDTFINALNSMIHRGPDDFGYYAKKQIQFGHRRLTILDLDHRSAQPMLSSDGNCVITFNGEIYNYLELRSELAQSGISFKTSSDTEVLLSGLQLYGIDFVRKCIGMFAFAFHDFKKSVTYIVRDRLGIKPLYYYRHSDAITFSSEIKAILQLETRQFSLNKKAISSYLAFRYPILNDSFFEEINPIPAGHYIEIRGKQIRLHEYWNPSHFFQEQENDKGEEFYIQRLRELLTSAVSLRMRSDVPFGAFLSGGVDSSVIAAIMAKESKQQINTFTIGFSEDGYNEFDYARQVSDLYKTRHREIILSGTNYIETMEKLISFKDSPLSVPNEVPLYEMSAELKKYITVVLSGEGADEIFGGYGRIFRSPFDYARLKNPNKFSISSSNQLTEFKDHFYKKYECNDFNAEIDHFLAIYAYTADADKQRFISNDVYSTHIESELRERFNSYFDELSGSSYTNKMMYAFERVHLQGLLYRVDMTTMATSVEARVPFVDHRLVEFAFTIPEKYKLKWNSESDYGKSRLLMSDQISEQYDTPKYILKKYAEELLPDSILYRKKMGFPVPLNRWFGGEFNDYAKDILLSKSSKERGIINHTYIETQLNNASLKNNHADAMKIWMLINLELFCRKYF